jgi:hypothetical protein
MDIELKDWLNSIYQNKNDIIQNDVTVSKKYPSFVINRMLSGNIDTVLFASELNERFTMDKDMQYKYLLYAIPARKRFSNYIKKSNYDNLELVKQYYGYNTDKALDALRLLSKEQIAYIKQKLNVGGI